MSTFRSSRSTATRRRGPSPELIARLVAHEKPHLFTTPRSVAKRQKNRVYFDYLQIGKSKTIAAPYVLRAYEGAPVATPWSGRKWCPDCIRNSLRFTTPASASARRATCSAACWRVPQNLYEALGRLEKLFK